MGQDSGHSSLIEVRFLFKLTVRYICRVHKRVPLISNIFLQGFTAGGFIYISVAGVLAEMNNSGKTTLVNTVIQLISLVSGMAVALCISLVE